MYIFVYRNYIPTVVEEFNVGVTDLHLLSNSNFFFYVHLETIKNTNMLILAKKYIYYISLLNCENIVK